MITITASYDFTLQEATFDILGIIVTISNPNNYDDIWENFSQTGDVFSCNCQLNEARTEAEFYIYATEKIQGEDITLWNHFLYLGKVSTGQTAIWSVDYDFLNFQTNVNTNGVQQLIENPNGDTQFQIAQVTERGSEPVDTEMEIRLSASKTNCEIFMYPLELGVRDIKSEFRVGEFNA